MLSFTQFILSESYRNLFKDDIEQKEKYADQVWDMLQAAYKSMGGIKGSGFNSKEDMIKNIPFWKINVVDVVVKCVVMYKDKGGRKLVASASDNTPEGLKYLSDSYDAEMKRSFGEKSKRALGHAIKVLGGEYAENFMIEPKEVSRILKKDVTPVDEYLKKGGELSKDDAFTYDKYSEYRKYMYIREIGGSPTLKITFGTPGLKIT